MKARTAPIANRITATRKKISAQLVCPCAISASMYMILLTLVFLGFGNESVVIALDHVDSLLNNSVSLAVIRLCACCPNKVPRRESNEPQRRRNFWYYREDVIEDRTSHYALLVANHGKTKSSSPVSGPPLILLATPSQNPCPPRIGHILGPVYTNPAVA